ncbi:MAG: calcium/sodium antiporter [Eubacteriales bacterium]|nr:calcium/sodium antiporter [Eubacteriales bacterium]
MGNIIYFVLFVLGLILIIKGSDWFIDAVIWIANVFNIPYIIIGATIVSICTTLPETFVSLTASVKGETDVAFGNAIGSIAVNTGFIMAILLLFAKPIIEDKKDYTKNGVFLISLMILVMIIGFTMGEINRWIGIGLLCLLILYLLNNVLSAKKLMRLNADNTPSDEQKHVTFTKKDASRYAVKFIIGISFVVLGSNLLVDNGIQIAEILGVPSILIAVTFTALGTSLPELVTTITSIRKKASNLGVGNIIGADILNIIQVVSVSSLITPIPLAHDPCILNVQLPFTLGIVTLAVLFGTFSKTGFKRWQGLALVLSYSIFVALNMLRENTPILGPIFFGM